MALQREQVVQTAEKFVSRGKIEPAIREYKKLLAENPNDINTLNRVGDLYAKIQRIDEAIDFFTQIAERYTVEGFFVKAIAIYKKIIKLDPTRLEVYEKLAELYHKQGLVNEARTQYQVLGDYYQKHDNAASAIAIYLKMTELEPDNPSYHVKLAEIYQQQQLIEKAMGEYRIIAELMIGHGHAQEAAQVYERALDVDSRNVGFIRDAVRKLESAGNAAGASRFLAVAIDRNPAANEIRLSAAALLAPEEDTSLELAVEDFTPAPDVYDSVPLAGTAVRDHLAGFMIEEEPPAFALEEIQAEEAEEDDLAGALRQAAASVPAAGPSSATLESREIDEIELDLDDVFVLDLEEEDGEPASLVKPPPDMVGTEPRRPAWAQSVQAPDEPVAPAAPSFSLPAEEDEAIELEIDLSFDDEPFVTPVPSLEALEAVEPLAAAEPDAGGEEVLEFDELTLDLEPMDFGEMEVDFPQVSAPEPEVPASSTSSAPGPPFELDTDLLERTAAELNPQQLDRDEDLISEAEVLAKYGLEEKALERLREALRLRPRHLGAYALMIQIHLDKGRHARVQELANHMASVAAESRDGSAWTKLRKRLLDAGYRLDGDRVVAVPARKGKDEGVQELLKGLIPETPARKPRPAAARPPVAEEQPPEPPPPPVVIPPPPPPVVPAAPPPTPPPAAPRPAMFNPLEIADLVESEDLETDGAMAGWGNTPLGADAFPSWQEAAPSAAPPPPPAGGNPLLDDSAMSWLDESNGRGKPAESADSLFDEDDDFFDLAGELEQELSQEDLFQDDAALMPTEQSLEEIVEGFKKGVAEHLSPTDYDTHFNLGIAYREMGLLDEAIGEFQLASKSPGHLVSCCSMLGLCFLDKGLPQLAIKWYQRGLAAPGASEEDSLGLLYDLGNAYLSVGDNPSAYRTYVELYGINSNYRDVVAKLEELNRAH